MSEIAEWNGLIDYGDNSLVKFKGDFYKARSNYHVKYKYATSFLHNAWFNFVNYEYDNRGRNCNTAPTNFQLWEKITLWETE